MTGALDNEKRNLAWDFVIQNEDISQYVLYLACQYMDFKYIKDHEIAFSDDYEMRKRQAEKTAKMIKSHIE